MPSGWVGVHPVGSISVGWQLPTALVETYWVVNYPCVKVKTGACVGRIAMSKQSNTATGGETYSRTEQGAANQPNSDGNISRRKIIRQIGTVSTVMIGISSGQAVKAEGSSTGDEVTAPERGQIADRALHDPHVERISNYLETNGWYREKNKMSVARVDSKGSDTEHYGVVLMFNNQKENEEGAILWQSDDTSVFAYTIERDDRDEPHLMVYWVANDHVKTQAYIKGETDGSVRSKDSVGTRDIGCPPICTPVASAWTCDGSVDVDCIVDAASTAGIGCSPCALDPSRVSCIPCALILLNQGRIGRRDCCSGQWEPVLG